MRYIILLILALMLVGCGDDMQKVANVNTTSITWIREVPVKCADAKSPMGCATIVAGHGACHITMLEDSPDWLIAHEFKHCFGYEHKTGMLL